MNRLKANILGLALLCCLPMGAQMRWNQTYQTYINQYKDLAIEQMLRYRIPASITLAQGLFESAAGRSDLVRQGDRFMATHSGTDQPVNAEGLLHPIHIFNKNYYLYAREGDTFKSIGKEVGISWRKLARYNERDKHTILRKGDIIYLKKKRSKAPKQYKGRPHVIKPGESMYVISQKYGIRLEKLYKMNHLDPNIPVSIGTRLRVR